MTFDLNRGLHGPWKSGIQHTAPLQRVAALRNDINTGGECVQRVQRVAMQERVELCVVRRVVEYECEFQGEG